MAAVADSPEVSTSRAAVGEVLYLYLLGSTTWTWREVIPNVTRCLLGSLLPAHISARPLLCLVVAAQPWLRHRLPCVQKVKVRVSNG